MDDLGCAAASGYTARDLFVPDFEPANTRERLLMAAVDLFYAHGIHAVGLDRILSEVGVTKTTFYNHFESKDELVAEAMRWRDQWERTLWEKMVGEMGGDDPKRRLLAYFDVLDIWFNDERFRGCQFINAAAEFPSVHEPAHIVAREHLETTCRGAAELAAKAGAGEPEAFAEEYAAVISGVIVLRQTTGNNAAAAIGRRVAEQLCGRHFGGAPRGA